MLVFFCFIVGASSLMMIAAGTEIGVMDYSSIVEKSLGPRWRLANDVSIFLANMGALMSYVNIIGALGMQIAEYLQPHGWSLLNTYPGFMVFFCLLFVLPCNLRRSYGEFTDISACSLFLIAS